MQKTLKEMIVESNLEACARRNEADADKIAKLEAERVEYTVSYQRQIRELEAELAESKKWIEHKEDTIVRQCEKIAELEADAIKWQNLFLKLTRECEDLEAKYHKLENHHADCLSRASDKIKEKVMHNEALRAVNDYTRNLKVSGMTGENNPNCKCQGGWTCPSCRYVIETVCSLKSNRIAELEAELSTLKLKLIWIAVRERERTYNNSITKYDLKDIKKQEKREYDNLMNMPVEEIMQDMEQYGYSKLEIEHYISMAKESE